MPDIIQWRSVANAPQIATGDLHLWRIRTDTTGLNLSHGLELLGDRQRARAEQMRHRPYRERYIRAQAGLRLVLAYYLDTPPESIVYAHGPAGKPYLPENTRPVSFNLTTTGDLALVGISAGRGAVAELGVDCEWIRPRIDILAVAKRMFRPELLRSLEDTPEPERLDAFYRTWTAHEADAKADGRGLFRPRAPEAIPPAIAHCIPEPGYVAAIARASLPPASEWVTLDLDAG
jgi:4'-phosphopantetheinyl transferase